MASHIKLAEYLFARLRQLGVNSVFGVPGDYNLTLLDYVEPSGLKWIGTCNELNAGYAADGYSRINGLGALVTTFGVGELSAINAVAGAYAERAPLVHIVGAPKRDLHESRTLIHHTLLDGDYTKFAQMHAHVTVAQTSLWDPRLSPAQIDETLQQCLLHSRPVYINIPQDLVDVSVSAESLKVPITIPPAIYNSEEISIRNLILDRIYASKRPIIYVDGESRAFGIIKEVEQLIKVSNWPTWTSPFGHGLIDANQSNVYGVYQPGNYPKYKEVFESSDLIICFGPHFSNVNTSLYTGIPKTSASILVSGITVSVDGTLYRDLPAKEFITKIVSEIDPKRLPQWDPQLSEATSVVDGSKPKATGPLTQKDFYRHINHIFQSGDIVLAETGSASNGARDFKLPPDTRMFVPATWLSIGYMLPAALGAGLAQRELIKSTNNAKGLRGRTYLLIGDGSFQMTAQEVSTMIREKLDVTIILINNDGYTIERCIHGRDQGYNDIARWRYLKAPGFFGADEEGPNTTPTFTASTFEELDAALSDERVQSCKGLAMIEVMFGRLDGPPILLSILDRQLKAEQQKQQKNGA